MSSIACIAFTERGCRLAVSLAAQLPESVRVSGPERFSDAAGCEAYGSLDSWTRAAFAEDDALVFVGAAGIAVRAIAPYAQDKFSDPAVVCIDEAGRVAVPLLSGHVGGANDLAVRIAALTGGIAAVSTATDVNGLFAVDVFAREQGLAIGERALAKEISAALLEGKPVQFDEGLGAVVTSDLAVRPFERTLHLVPRDIVVGVGCRRGVSTEAVASAIEAALAQANVPANAVFRMASIDVKAEEPALVQLAHERGWEFATYSAAALARVEGTFASSDFVRDAVGVDNVCERAVVAAGSVLLAGKAVFDGVTVAVGRLGPSSPDCSLREAASRSSNRSSSDGGCLFVVGLGPGAGSDLTIRAQQALSRCDLILGYKAYIDLIADEFSSAELRRSGMRSEVARCREALEAAAHGRTVALVCSGDAGVYGMASPVLELSEEYPGVSIEIVPGVTAALGGAAVLGAPLAHDFAVVSLSDLLTPWEDIEARLAAAAASGFGLCLYNPSSHARADYLRRACDIVLRHRDEATVCGIVRNIGRSEQAARVMSLGELRDAPVDMFTTVFIGNSSTRVVGEHLVTPRGYAPSGNQVADAGGNANDARPRPEVLVFGGTSEGRELAEWLSGRGARVAVSVATEYGASLVDGSASDVLVGRLDADGMAALLAERSFDYVVDATHPYAALAHENIAAAAAATGARLVRLARQRGAVAPAVELERAAQQAADFRGNVLLTTGSKDVGAFVRVMPDFAERLYVRILPVRESLDAVLDQGIPAAHVVAMQGPFTREMNEALIRSLDIGLLVTKDSGARGGFQEKIDAAAACGIDVVVVGRPAAAHAGLSLQQVKELLSDSLDAGEGRSR